MPELLNVKQSAKYLRVPAHVLYRAATRGAIGHWRIGGRVMFARPDLNKLVRYIPARAN